jgi:uncharacterized protein YqjF (DUF2071 family)
MLQSWRRLTFLHWRYDAAELRARLPRGLELDLFDGAAWVGLTPFLLENLRVPRLPALPWIWRFPETNLRTYVRGPGGERGIWFFSLDAARLLAVAGARITYGLPYRWSEMSVAARAGVMHYRSERRDAGADIVVETGEPYTSPGELDHFLTARFRLYTVLWSRLACAPVDHSPWPLWHARAARVRQRLMRAAGLETPPGEPLAHYSPGVDVRVGAPRFV